MTDERPWIDWDGGDCPVDPDVRVDVRYRGGGQMTGGPGKPRARHHDRRHMPDYYPENDIVAYRVSVIQ